MLHNGLGRTTTQNLLDQRRLSCLLSHITRNRTRTKPIRPRGNDIRVRYCKYDCANGVRAIDFQVCAIGTCGIARDNRVCDVSSRADVRLVCLPNGNTFLRINILSGQLPTTRDAPRRRIRTFLARLSAALSND